MDSFVDLFTGTTFRYLHQSLVAGNIFYYNGNRGIHVFDADGVTVANNTLYDDVTDPGAAQPPGPACCLGELSLAGSSNSIWVNNIAKLVTAAGAPGTLYCALITGDTGNIGSTATATYTNNSVSDAGSAACITDDTNNHWNCTNNKCNTDPLFVDATSGATEGTIAIFTGSIGPASTTLHVSAGPSQGTLAIGQFITDNTGAVTPGTKIVSGSGATWTLNNSQTVGSRTLNAAPPPTGAGGTWVPGNNNFALQPSSPLRSAPQYLATFPANYGACFASLSVCPTSTGGRF